MNKNLLMSLVVVALLTGSSMYAPPRDGDRMVTADTEIRVPFIGKVRMGEWGRQTYSNKRLLLSATLGIVGGIITACLGQNNISWLQTAANGHPKVEYGGFLQDIKGGLRLGAASAATLMLGTGTAGVQGACLAGGSGFFAYQLAKIALASK